MIITVHICGILQSYRYTFNIHIYAKHNFVIDKNKSFDYFLLN